MRTSRSRRHGALDHRQAEGQRLAGAGLRLAGHVAPFERVGDRHRLYRERFGDALLGEYVHKVVGDAEFRERLVYSVAVGLVAGGLLVINLDGGLVFVLLGTRPG